MRAVIVLAGAALITLAGCSSSRENVRTAYAGTASMTPAQVGQLLHDEGYTDVTDLHQNGKDWVGAATNKSGDHVDFDIDKAGVIHTK